MTQHQSSSRASRLAATAVTPHAVNRWTVRRILLATLTVLGVAVVFALLYRFYMVIFLFFVAVSIQVAFDPVVTWWSRRGVRKEIGVVILYCLLALAMVALIWYIAPLFAEEIGKVIGSLPDGYKDLRSQLLSNRLGLVRGFAFVLPAELSLPALAASAQPAGEEEAAPVWTYVGLVIRVAFSVLAVFFMAYFWTREGAVIVRRLVLQAPAARRDEVRAVVAEIQGKINGYFRGQLILCSTVGGLSMVAFLLIGVPNAILLGILMGLFEAVPVVGPVLGAIPALVMAAATAPDKVPWVLGAVIVIQVAESNFLVPRVMDQSVGVNAIVSLLAIAAFGILFGFAGAILAVPLAAVVQILLDRLLFRATLLDNSINGADTNTAASRSQTGVLRHKVRELIQDVRKLARTGSGTSQHSADASTTPDTIETLALQLDSYLATLEERR